MKTVRPGPLLVIWDFSCLEPLSTVLSSLPALPSELYSVLLSHVPGKFSCVALKLMANVEVTENPRCQEPGLRACSSALQRAFWSNMEAGFLEVMSLFI